MQLGFRALGVVGGYECLYVQACSVPQFREPFTGIGHRLTYTYTYIHMLHKRMHAYISIDVSLHIAACIHTCKTCKEVSMYASMYVPTYVCVYVSIRSGSSNQYNTLRLHVPL